MLALAQVQQRHDCGLLVLWWVPLEDLGDDGFILGGKFEGDAGVVVGCVSVLLQLRASLASPSQSLLVVREDHAPRRVVTTGHDRGFRRARTTMSESLGLEAVTESARVCGLAALRAERAAVLNTRGAILLAMVGRVEINGRKLMMLSPH